MRAFARVAGLGLLALVAASCTLNTDYFSDYRGKNLISNADFGSAGKWALVSDATLAAATLTSPYSPTDYMTWERVATAGHAVDGAAFANTPTLGPDGASPAYRLEILNLIPDGDFENQTINGTSLTGDTFWTVSNAQHKWLTSTVVSGNTFTLNHVAMSFNDVNSPSQPGATATLTLQTAVNASAVAAGKAGGTYWDRTGGYRFRFDLYNLSTGSSFGLNVGASANTTAENAGNWLASGLDAPSVASPTRYTISRFITIDGTAQTVTLGTPGTSSDAALIDNVRFLNTDVDPAVNLTLTSLSSGTATLLPGSKSGAYKFTVYVHDDPTANQNALTSHQANRFYPSGLSVVISAAVKSGAGVSKTFFARPSGGWTGWTKLTVDLGFDFVNSDADLGSSPALTIELSPTNLIDNTTGGRDVGSLLVTQPTLTFNP